MTTESTQTAEATPKLITGYCEPLSLRAGETIRLMASSHRPGPVELDVVRISCGDPTRAGPGYSETSVPAGLPTSVVLDEQTIVPGSYATVDLSGLTATSRLTLELHVMATRPVGEQVVAALDGAFSVVLDDGRLSVRTSAGSVRVGAAALARARWYRLEVGIDLEGGRVDAALGTAPTRSPARDLVEDDVAVSGRGPVGPVELGSLLLAASPEGHRFDGRVARPSLTVDGATLRWDLAAGMAGRRMVETSEAARHGTFHQLPTRAVTGPSWDESVQRWTDDPSRYDAVHFHHDDVYDAGWPAIVELELDDDMTSGIYAFRLRGAAGEDRVPFFVRPAAGAPTAEVALLMPSCTYMAYANHRMLFEGADFMGARTRLRPEHAYVRDHPELGRSMYEKHPDGSGVMFSSRRRPVLQLRPGADGWNFTPDTDLNAFLDHTGVGHDVLADEDLHHEGVEALRPYRVLVTGTHPEYWSTAMLDALELWQRSGGRLMYLGGNGFYWRVAFSDEWPGAIELRRTEDGVRNWQTGPGESYHAWGGEYGGLWRRLGRAPNELVGVGFAAQGFEHATHFERTDASYDSRAAWIFDGVDDRLIGTSGLGGGAAGQEIDRYDTRLGSPDHAVVLASATEFGPDMLRTKEEFEGSVAFPTPDPYVRADMLFFETPSGGAVFSASSISWFGALARDGYRNDVARITTNVLRRFVDPEPFPPPSRPDTD